MMLLQLHAFREFLIMHEFLHNVLIVSCIPYAGCLTSDQLFLFSKLLLMNSFSVLLFNYLQQLVSLPILV